jgi:hypothetical protein
MNLYIQPACDTMAYPEYEIVHQSDSRLTLLGVGDSFFKTFMDIGLMERGFSSDSRYLFYNKRQILPNGKDAAEAQRLSVSEMIEKSDLIILCYTEPNLRMLGNGFMRQGINILQKR